MHHDTQAQENLEATQRRIQAHEDEVGRATKLHTEREEAAAEARIRVEREKVVGAKEDSVAWRQRTRRLEASYKAHAAKTAVLVHSLEAGAQRQVARLHEEALCSRRVSR